MTDAYGPDLAFIHDAGFGDIARGAANALIATLKRAGFHDGLVVDLGCGSGILGERLTDAGFDVLGIDISPAFIELARRRVSRGRFEVGSAFTAEIPPCVAVAAVGEVFNYLFDPNHSDNALTDLFIRVRAALAPRGVLLFDIATPGRSSESGSRKTWATGDDWAVLSHSVEDAEHRILTRSITTFRRDGALYRRRDETHRLRLYRADSVSTRLDELGFDVVEMNRYGDTALPPGVVAFTARNPVSE